VLLPARFARRRVAESGRAGALRSGVPFRSIRDAGVLANVYRSFVVVVAVVVVVVVVVVVNVALELLA
jgi:hypothetical protein